MKYLVPHPLMSICLVAIWLLLNQSISPAHIIVGGVIALVTTRAMAALRVSNTRMRLTMAIPRLAMVVLSDIVRSNLAVARIILFSRTPPTSGFVRIPLETNNPYCLAVLACIITSTPGTLWMEHDSRSNILLLHVLDLVDEKHWIDVIKHRYERLLTEIFV
jgi:multicomponent K+:H+ antiporter subunit E